MPYPTTRLNRKGGRLRCTSLHEGVFLMPRNLFRSKSGRKIWRRELSVRVGSGADPPRHMRLEDSSLYSIWLRSARQIFSIQCRISGLIVSQPFTFADSNVKHNLTRPHHPDTLYQMSFESDGQFGTENVFVSMVKIGRRL